MRNERESDPVSIGSGEAILHEGGVRADPCVVSGRTARDAVRSVRNEVGRRFASTSSNARHEESGIGIGRVCGGRNVPGGNSTSKQPERNATLAGTYACITSRTFSRYAFRSARVEA